MVRPARSAHQADSKAKLFFHSPLQRPLVWIWGHVKLLDTLDMTDKLRQFRRKVNRWERVGLLNVPEQRRDGFGHSGGLRSGAAARRRHQSTDCERYLEMASISYRKAGVTGRRYADDILICWVAHGRHGKMR